MSDTIYSELPSVHRLTNYEELPKTIRDSLKLNVNIDDLNLFINKIINNSFEFDSESLLVLFNNEFYYGGFLFDKDVSIESAEKLRCSRSNSLLLRSDVQVTRRDSQRMAL